MQRIDVTQEFSAPVDRVYAHLAKHENLERVFGAQITRLRDGDTAPDGVGSVRRMKVNPLLPPFEETVTQAVPGELIEYRITRGSPLKDHVGVMRFSPTGAGTRLDYTIEFESKVPGAGGVFRRAIEKNVRSGLRQIAAEL